MTKSQIPPSIPRFYDKLFRFGVISLPFSYHISGLGLLGFAALMVLLLKRFGRTALDQLTRNSLLTLSGLLILSSLLAYNKGEAFLQLAHFLPYFLLFSILPYLLRRVEHLEQVAFSLVIASLPINIIAGIQYVLRLPLIPRRMRRNPIVDWVRDAPHRGRAMAMFDHPNVLASYLVVIFGLGLGLLLKYSIQMRSQRFDHLTSERHLVPFWVLAIVTYLNLAGIFFSGSRNGLVIAVLQLIAFTFFVSFFKRASRAAWVTGLLSLLTVLLGSAFLGIGGRAVSLVGWVDDPRFGVWRIALDLIREHPLLGWGLGNYKILYPLRRLESDFPRIFHPHNFWLLLGSEAGLLVMLGLTVLIGYICYRATRLLAIDTINPDHKAILLSYLFAFGGIIAFGMFDVTFYDARINILNWLILAGIYSFVQIVQPPQAQAAFYSENS